MNKKAAIKKKSKSLKPGFSLIELSIVLLIVGFIVTSVIATNNLLIQSRIANGKALTDSSGIKNMDGLLLWYDAMSDQNSFTVAPSNNSSIGVWKDMSGNKIDAIQTTDDYKPTYIKKALRGLPALRFDGVNDYLAFSGSKITNDNYSIVVIGQRTSGKDNNYFIGGTGSSSNSNLYLGYENNTNISHSQTGIVYSAPTDPYTAPVPSVNIFVNSSANGKSYYQDGQLVASSPDTNSLGSFDGAAIGKHNNDYFQGDISEVMIFNNALTPDQIAKINDYAGNKWNITTPTNPAPSTESNCNLSVTGVSQTSVNSSSGTLACDQTGYTGFINYTCSAGSFSSSSCSCDSANHYVSISNSCVLGCNTTTITGVSSEPSTVSAGSSSFNCDATGYTGTVNYTCSAGVFTPGTCGCATNYTWSGGMCGFHCQMTTETGIDPGTYVNHGSTSQSCASGYSGTINYTCNNGTYNKTSGSCTPTSCSVSVTGVSSPATVSPGSGTLYCNATGYNNTSFSYNCSGGTAITGSNCDNQCNTGAGYSWTGSSCQQGCAFYGVTGMINGTQVNYTGSWTTIACNVNEYQGSNIQYTCTGGYINTSGTCAQTWFYQRDIQVNSGADWTTNPPTYSCREACSIGQPDNWTHFHCSSGTTYMDTEGPYVVWGTGPCQYYQDGFKACNNFNGNGCTSAYVNNYNCGGSAATIHCWHQ